MLKRIVLATAVAVASMVSFQMGKGGTPSVAAPPEAAACWPPDFLPWDTCGCSCCEDCAYWGSSCPGCQ